MDSHRLRRYVKPFKVSVKCKLFIYKTNYPSDSVSNMLKGCTWTYYDDIIRVSLSHSYVNPIPSWKWIDMSLSQQYANCRQIRNKSFVCYIWEKCVLWCVCHVCVGLVMLWFLYVQTSRIDTHWRRRKKSIEREDRDRKMPAWESNCQISACNDSLKFEDAVTPLWMTW